MSKLFSRLIIGMVLFFLYIPILVIFVFSFNSGPSTAVFQGFSIQPYSDLFRYHSALTNSLVNSLILATVSSVISTIFGTLAAVAMFNVKNKRVQGTLYSVNRIPIMNPEIVTGISMMLMFIFVGRAIGAATSLSFVTLLLAHITFSIPYVVLNVLPKLYGADPHMMEAARDLGCTPARAFIKVTLPTISTGMIAGMMMVFALSLDDFVISFFTSGTGFRTLPITIYGITRGPVRPPVYALSTLIFITIFTLLVISNLIQIKSEKKRNGVKL